MTNLAALVTPSPLGDLTLVASTDGLRAVLWEKDDPRRVPLGPTVRGHGHPVLEEAAREIAEYWAGHRTRFTVTLDPNGTPFQLEVWRVLSSIPYGGTASYGEIATMIGRPNAARAVGAANGRNPLSIIVPCHRVVGADGALTGFAGGIDAKRNLLDHEREVLRVLRTATPAGAVPGPRTRDRQSQRVG